MIKRWFKISLIVFFVFGTVYCAENNRQKPDNMQTENNIKTLHDFKVLDIQGKEYDLSSLKGKKILVVNVASKCGLTPQYEELQALYEKYRDRDFLVIGFPANNFNEQEPGSNAEIMEFCEANYGVTFPMMAKISVTGDDQAPLYTWLTRESENGVLDQEVTWNFQKFMIDEEGRLVDVVMPRESPMSEKIVNWISGD
ncbi:MAG: glutathione peroxidase [Bacteroidales bacterium]|nr:glutathione peroxidase [Bacteroidales bacterium]